MSVRFRMKRPTERAGIGKILFAVIIIAVILISSTFTYLLVTMTRGDSDHVADSNLLSPYEDLFPIGSNTSSSVNDTTTTSCYTGNWSSIYSQYQSPLSLQQNATTLGQQYLNDPQFMSFLSQYLNMSDPYVNSTVVALLSGNETSLVQQQIQSQGLTC